MTRLFRRVQVYVSQCQQTEACNFLVIISLGAMNPKDAYRTQTTKSLTRSMVALGGAIMTLLALVLDPFAQQTVASETKEFRSLMLLRPYHG